MANALYPQYKEAMLTCAADADFDGGDLRAILIDLADYTYVSTHDYLDDVAGASRVSTSSTIGSKTITDGTADCANFTFSSVSGDESEALIFYLHTGTESTSRLLAFYDTGVTGFPVTPNGGDINVTVNASGLWSL